MVLVLAQIPSLSGIPRDLVENSFVGRSASLTPAALALTMRAALTSFYNVGVGGATHAPAQYIGPSRDRGANKCTFKSYDVTDHLDGSPHGSPIPGSDATWTLGATTNVDGELPSQVCVDLSYTADIADFPEFGSLGSVPSDERAIDEGAPATHTGRLRPRSRHRGHISIGPLFSSSAASSGPGGASIPIAIMRHDITVNAAALRDDPSFDWVVWSRRNAAVDNVIAGYCDDRWDTIRKRLPRATTRTTF